MNGPQIGTTSEKREGTAIMSDLQGYKRQLSIILRQWADEDYGAAFAEVESLLKIWPGNAHLHILWAGLLQLQDDPRHDLDEAKRALQQAVELDEGSPAAAIELGHFLDTVVDDPHAASKAYAEGVAAARHLLVEGLIGQAEVFRKLEKRAEFLSCLQEAIQLRRLDAVHAEQIREMLGEAFAGRSV